MNDVFVIEVELNVNPAEYIGGITDELEKAQRDGTPPQTHTIFALYDLSDILEENTSQVADKGDEDGISLQERHDQWSSRHG